MLAISRNTLNLWLKREQETGDFKALAGYQKGKKPKIKNLQSFEKFVLQHSNKTQQRIAQLWGNNLTQHSGERCNEKTGYNQKKKPMGIEREMKRRENNFSNASVKSNKIKLST